jgi:hypothetical protein
LRPDVSKDIKVLSDSFTSCLSGHASRVQNVVVHVLAFLLKNLFIPRGVMCPGSYPEFFCIGILSWRLIKHTPMFFFAGKSTRQCYGLAGQL